MNLESQQWVVVVDGRLIQTYGREKGSMQKARARATEYGWGARALLLTQEQIDYELEPGANFSSEDD